MKINELNAYSEGGSALGKSREFEYRFWCIHNYMINIVLES